MGVIEVSTIDKFALLVGVLLLLTLSLLLLRAVASSLISRTPILFGASTCCQGASARSIAIRSAAKRFRYNR